MEDEKKDEEQKDELSEVIRQARELIEEQKKTIESQKAKIEELRKNNVEKQEAEEGESVSDMLKDFKKNITELLQGYNRKNPADNSTDTSFEDAQMDMLKRRF